MFTGGPRWSPIELQFDWVIARLRTVQIVVGLLIIAFGLSIAMTVFGSHGDPYVDATGPSAEIGSGGIAHNGALFVKGGVGAGTGTFDPFLQLQVTPIESGFNSDSTAVITNHDVANGSVQSGNTKAVKVAAVPTVDIGGTAYREFLLDSNDTGSDAFMSIDQLKLFIDDEPDHELYLDVSETFDDDSGMTAMKIWDLDLEADQSTPDDTAVLMCTQSCSAGSGVSDIGIYVPDSVFPAECAYGSDHPSCADLYLIVWATLGGLDDDDYETEYDGQPKDWDTDSGFEEFKFRPQPVVRIEKTAEASFDRSWDWQIVKEVSVDGGPWVDAASTDLFENESEDIQWRIRSERIGPTDSNWLVTGQVTITNPTGGDVIESEIAAEIVDISDTLTLDGVDADIALNCPQTVPFTLDAGDSIVCTYSYSVTTDPEGAIGFNVAAVTLDLDGDEGDETAVYATAPDDPDAQIDFGNALVDESDEAAVIDDPDQGVVGVAAGGSPILVDDDIDCSLGTWENTATLTTNDTSTVLDDDAEVTVTCHQLTVAKTAAATRGVDYDWIVTKTAAPELIQLFHNESSSVTWTVEVDKSEAQLTSQTLGGTITIENPHPTAAATVDVSDSYPGTTIEVDCDSGTTGAQSTGVSVPAGGSLGCTYTATSFAGSLVDGTNTATVAHVSAPDPATAPVVVQESVTDDCVDVSDVSDLGGGFGPNAVCEDRTVSGENAFSFSEPVDCDEDEGVASNTASISGDLDDPAGNSDTASVTIDCFQLTVDKTGNATRDVDHEWSVEKTADPTTLELFHGESGTIVWTVEVVKSSPITDSQSLTGTITITNPHPTTDAIVDVSDAYPTTTIAVDCDTVTDGDQNDDVVVPAGADLVCQYRATSFDGDLPDGVNTATVSHVSSPDPATAPITVQVAVTDDCVAVSDLLAPAGIFPDGSTVCESHTVSGENAYIYQTAPECGRDDFTVTNTATITGDLDTPGDNESTATTDVTCRSLSITKAVTPTFAREYVYLVSKEPRLPEDGVIDLDFGQSHAITWDIVLTEDGYTDSGFAIGTEIVITNPSPTRSAQNVTLSDSLAFVSLSCAWPGAEGVIPPASSVTCTSDDSVIGMAPLPTSNTASVSMTFDAAPVEHDSDEATWDWNTPTTEIDETVDVVDLFGPTAPPTDLSARLLRDGTTLGMNSYTWGDGTGDPRQAFWELMTVVSSDPGDTPDHLLECGLNEVPNEVVLLGDEAEVVASDDAMAPVVVTCDLACTLTQGYWRTHSAAGPRGNHVTYSPGDPSSWWKHRDETWDLLDDLDGDGVHEYEQEAFFGSGMTWWEVQWEAPQGRFYFNLAHQWIAAHLNWLNAGTPPPDEVITAYYAAEAWFASDPDPDARLTGQAKKDVVGWHGTLTAFNEGQFPGWPHCDENSEAEIEALAGLLARL